MYFINEAVFFSLEGDTAVQLFNFYVEKHMEMHIFVSFIVLIRSKLSEGPL